MRTSDLANRPRWRGGAGFFEVWFLVVFAPGARRAWWLRYTTFSPAAGRPGAARATLWGAAFAAGEAAFAAKHVLPADAYRSGDGEGFAIRIGDAELTNHACRGDLGAGGRTIAWDLRFTPAAREARRGPWLVDRLPLPTRVSHANSEIACSGTIALDGQRHTLEAAPAVQKHIWGTRRVEELFWLYCPQFAEDAAAVIEATAARLRRDLPGGFLTTLWLRSSAGDVDRTGLGAVLRNRVLRVAPTRIEFRATSTLASVHVTAWCDPRTLAGYRYRDPQGWEVSVAQSDVASCVVEIRARAHPLGRWGEPARLTCSEGAALEFHAPEPLPDVRYIAWDATA